MSKGITLDALARMMAEGFTGLEKGLSEKIDKVDVKVGGLQKEMKVGFAEINVRLNRMELLLIGAH